MQVYARGNGLWEVDAVLTDVKTRTAITNATVKLTVSSGTAGDTRTLKPFAADGALGYGEYFLMPSANPYTITAQIQRPGVAGATEAVFEYRVW